METFPFGGRHYPVTPPPGRLMPPEPQRLKRLQNALQCALDMMVPAERSLWKDLVWAKARVDAKVDEATRPVADVPDLPWTSTSTGLGN